MTYEEVANLYNITVDQARQLRRAMSSTWNQIGDDWLACFETEEEAYETYKTKAAMVAEATLDADRITIHCPEMDLTWLRSFTGPTLELGEHVWQCKS